MSRTQAERFRDEELGNLNSLEWELEQLAKIDSDIQENEARLHDDQTKLDAALARLTKPLWKYASWKWGKKQHPNAEFARQQESLVNSYQRRLEDLYTKRDNRDTLTVTLSKQIEDKRKEVDTWSRLATESRERINQKKAKSKPRRTETWIDPEERTQHQVVRAWATGLQQPLRYARVNHSERFTTRDVGQVCW